MSGVMKTITQSIRTLAVALVFGAASLSAQSCAAVGNFANASSHAVNASGEVLASGAASVAGSAQVGSAVVAIPVWMSGAAVNASGAVSSAVGDTAQKAGTAVAHGAEKLWDFASGDATQRPALDRSHAVVPPAAGMKPSAKSADPSPAEALRRM